MTSPDDIGEYEEDFLDEEEFALWLAQQAPPQAEGNLRRKSSAVKARNPPISHPFERLQECTYNGVRITPNSVVELQDEDFMKIFHVVKNNLTLEVTIRGYIFRRTREMNGLLNRKLNEVCWILHVDNDDPREPLVQGIETRAVSEVVRRRVIRLTNKPFPDLSFRGDEREKEDIITDQRVLVCRYKYLCFYSNAKARMTYVWCEKGLHRLREDECDKRADNDMKDVDLRCAWRGNTSLGGAQKIWLPGEKEYLRQEAISHKGNAIPQSLRAPAGPDFPNEEQMVRGGVGAILYKSDLPKEIDAFARTFQQRVLSSISTLRTSEAPSRDETDRFKSSLRSIHSPSDPVSPRSLLSDSEDLNTKSNNPDIEEISDLFDIGRGMRKNRLEPRFARDRSGQVVEINAQVKTSTRSGVFNKHYEGKITSNFIPSLKRTRSDDEPSESPATLRKRPHIRGLAAAPSSTTTRDMPYQKDCSSNTQTHRNNSLFRSIELDEDTKESRHRKTSLSGLLTPRSDEEYEARRLPSKAKLQKVLMREERQSAPNVVPEEVIDLTTPHTNVFNHVSNKLRRLSLLTQPASTESGSTTHQRVKESPSAQTFASKRPSSSLLRASNTRRYPSRPRYTFGDCFCGAGGMSRGAINAGLRISWGFDFSLRACQTYEKNFFGTPVYQAWADQFSAAGGDHKVDICHLSPPCQFFSDAHTINGKDDDMNIASLFSISELLHKAKPRVVTLEQTSGLIRRHPIFFNAVINMFTTLGFSVRWKVMNCADFGLPQRRLRLFIIASCHEAENILRYTLTNHKKTSLPSPNPPTPPLPTLPPPSNLGQPSTPPSPTSPQPGPTTPPTSPNAATPRLNPATGSPPASPPTAGPAISTQASFPLEHKFGDVNVKKQIGNAVPPIVATVLLEEVKRWLMRADGVVEEEVECVVVD